MLFQGIFSICLGFLNFGIIYNGKIDLKLLKRVVAAERPTETFLDSGFTSLDQSSFSSSLTDFEEEKSGITLTSLEHMENTEIALRNIENSKFPFNFSSKFFCEKFVFFRTTEAFLCVQRSEHFERSEKGSTGLFFLYQFFCLEIHDKNFGSFSPVQDHKALHSLSSAVYLMLDNSIFLRKIEKFNFFNFTHNAFNRYFQLLLLVP